MSRLNPRQQEAVSYVGGPLLVLAGAGSGKTSVITRKIAHLIQNCGIRAQYIVAMTFTNKAAREMKERVGTLLKVSRLPARAMGFGELQGFLERGFDAFGRLGDAESFLADIRASETRVMRRLFDGDADPFGAGDP